jgi:glycosyltransferase involved in cell wall biosynthesis
LFNTTLAIRPNGLTARAGETREADILNTPAVSIVTTTLNRTEYLKEAIQSALAQTFTDFEMLVCDDGGLDETKRLCDDFHDPRILHTVNPSRLGIAMNTYAGVKRARSGLIAFLNDDDRWNNTFLDRCAEPLLNDREAALAFSDHWLIDSKGTRLLDATNANTREYGREGLPAGPVKDPQALMTRLSIPLSMAAVFRKAKVDWSGYTYRVQGAYDSYIAYSLLRYREKVFYVPKRLTEYRTHSGGASARLHRQTTEGLAYVHGLMLRDPAYAGIRNAIRDKYGSLERHLVRLSLRDGDILSAVQHCARFARNRFI